MAGTTELATVDPTRVAAVSGAHFSNDQVEVIRNLFAQGATEDELVVFLSIAQKYDLDPFAREIWCICELDADGERKLDKKGAPRPPMIQASRAGWRKVAQRDPRCAGIEAGAVYSRDTFERMPDGTVRHGICLDVNDKGAQDRGKIVGAYALVFRHDWTRPAYAWASWQDYGVPQVADQNGRKPTWSPWYRFPSAMIEKQAESMALRQAFPLGAIASGDDRDVEASATDILTLPADPEPDPDARGTRPALTGAPRPDPSDADSPPTPAAPASPIGESTAPDGDQDAAANPLDLIGAGDLTGKPTSAVAKLVEAAKPMRRADLVRVCRWATRNDEWPAMAIAELDTTRAQELYLYLADATDEEREALAAAVVTWEQAQDDPQGTLA